MDSNVIATPKRSYRYNCHYSCNRVFLQLSLFLQVADFQENNVLKEVVLKYIYSKLHTNHINTEIIQKKGRKICCQYYEKDHAE
jgi:hypothetical protein